MTDPVRIVQPLTYALPDGRDVELTPVTGSDGAPRCHIRCGDLDRVFTMREVREMVRTGKFPWAA